MSQHNSFSELFKNKPFMMLWANQFCLQLSYSMTNFTLILWVYELTKLNTYVSFLILIISVPSIIFGFFAGVLADRIDRRAIIQVTDIMLAIIFFLFVFTGNNIPFIYVLAFFISVVSQFFLPAEGATIPTIVSKDLLSAANSLFSLTIYASLIIGYSFAGPIIIFTGSYITPFIVASFLTLCASLLFLFFPKIHPHTHKKRAERISESIRTSLIEIKQGLQYIFSHKAILVSLLLLTGVQAFVSTLSVLVPEYINKILQIRATNASYIIMLPLGLGLITGALFCGSYGKLISRRKLVEGSILGVSITLLALASAPVISDFLAFRVVELSLRFRRPLEHILGLSGLLVIFSYLLGFFNVCIVVPAQTTLHELTSEDFRGRVFGVLSMMMSTLASIPVVLVGSLADRFGTVSLISTIAVLVLSCGLFVQSKRYVTEKLFFSRD